jgi:putative transposase
MGQARPHRIGRHTQPTVKPDAPAPAEATGIDYLRLIDAAHQREVGQAINYPALFDDTGNVADSGQDQQPEDNPQSREND